MEKYHPAVTGYLNQLEPHRKQALQRIREAIHQIIPGTEETMEYRMPTFKKGVTYCAMASQKHYMAIYIMNTKLLRKYRNDLKHLNLGKSCIRFKKLDDLDTSNIEPTTHPIEGLKNVFREDIPWKSLTNEEALQNAEHKKDGFFKAPRILKE